MQLQKEVQIHQERLAGIFPVLITAWAFWVPALPPVLCMLCDGGSRPSRWLWGNFCEILCMECLTEVGVALCASLNDCSSQRH